MRTGIVKKSEGENLAEIIARMERKHPELKRSTPSDTPKTLEQMFGREKARRMRKEAAVRNFSTPSEN